MWKQSVKEEIGSNARDISYCTIRCVQVKFAPATEEIMLVRITVDPQSTQTYRGATLAKRPALMNGIRSSQNASFMDSQCSKSE